MRKKWAIKILASALLVGIVLAGTTLAYLHASSTPVKNTFEFAQVDTEIKEEGTAANEKAPEVLNTGKSPVYVRAKAIVISGEESDVLITENDVIVTYTESWVDGGDGYYYYNQILLPGENSKTAPLFNGVEVIGENVKNNSKAVFSVGVYQESTVAPASLPSGTDVVSAAKLAFSSTVTE